MAFTRADAYRTLAALRPARVFLQAYHTDRLPEMLELYFRPPEEFFLAPDSQARYTEGRWIPILDDGSFGLITFCDPETLALRQMHVESPGEVQVSFPNWNAYLADLMERVMESDDDPGRLRRIAELIGLRLPDE
jgi:hypothetical protein